MGSTPVGLSASRGSAVLGLNKYKSPLQAFLEISEAMKPGFCHTNGFLVPSRKDPWAEPYDPKLGSLRWGLMMEDPICEMVGGITDREKAFTHPKYDFLTCHIDGRIGPRNQENKTAFEMAFKMGWGAPGSELIPDDYQVQGQHQMMCSTMKITDFNVLVFPKSVKEWESQGFKPRQFGHIETPNDGMITALTFAWNLYHIGYFHKFHVPENLNSQKNMIDRYRAFWNDNILKEVPPPIEGYNDIKWLFASPEGEIEASSEMRELWDEYIDGKAEIQSINDRNFEIKNSFSQFVYQSMLEKNIKPGNEKRKINVMSGRRKLFSVSRPWPGTRISAPSVDRMKDDAPLLYEEAKKITFLDILGEMDLTEKQAEKAENLDAEWEELSKKIGEYETLGNKFLKSLKLTKLLSRSNIMKQLEKSHPDIHKKFREYGLLVETEPVSRLNVSKPSED